MLCKIVCGFDFNHNGIITNKISNIILLQWLPIIINCQFLLTLKRNSLFCKLPFLSFLIYSLQKARSQLRMNDHACPNDFITLFLMNYISHRSSLVSYIRIHSLNSRELLKVIQHFIPAIFQIAIFLHQFYIRFHHIFH